VIDALISSKVRIALLRLFLLNPTTTYHARGLTKLIDATYNAIWKELQNLERAGFVVSEAAFHLRAYRINPNCPILSELRSIFLKTTALGDALRPILGAANNVRAAFVYGSAATADFDADSDIDLMVIGDVTLTAFAARISAAEKELGRSINYVLYSEREWNEKRRKREPFVENVLAGPKVFLKGDEAALRKTDSTETHQAVSRQIRRNQAAAQTRRPRPRHRGA